LRVYAHAPDRDSLKTLLANAHVSLQEGI